MNRQQRRNAERLARKSGPPTVGPSQEASAAFQQAVHYAQVAEEVLRQFAALKDSLTEEDEEELEIMPDIEQKLRRRQQLARIAVVDAGIGLIGLPRNPDDEPRIITPDNADVGQANAELLAAIEAEEARG